jgi:hypothetical protein
MSPIRFSRAGLLVAVLGTGLVPALAGFAPSAMAQAMRPEIGKPLQEAGTLMKAKKYKDALAKIRETDSVAAKTPAEQLTIERTRASAAQLAGDYDVAAKSFEQVLATGKLPAAEAQKIAQAIPSLYFQTKNWNGAISSINRYLKDYGDDAAMRGYLIQAYYQSGDFKRVQSEVKVSIDAAEKAGRAPTEESLQMLANAALKQGDKAGYVNSIEKLVAYYPKRDYWADLLSRVASKPGFSDRLSLDVYRLRFATGLLRNANDYMEMSQLSLQAKAPAEALKIIDQAYSTKTFGTGAEADRQKRLKALADKSATEFNANSDALYTEMTKNADGVGLADLGFALVASGKADKGLGILGDVIKEGKLKRQEDAKLHMGIALMNAGKKAEAVKMFKSVTGTDGTAELARYWVLYLKAA